MTGSRATGGPGELGGRQRAPSTFTDGWVFRAKTPSEADDKASVLDAYGEKVFSYQNSVREELNAKAERLIAAIGVFASLYAVKIDLFLGGPIKDLSFVNSIGLVAPLALLLALIMALLGLQLRKYGSYGSAENIADLFSNADITASRAKITIASVRIEAAERSRLTNLRRAVWLRAGIIFLSIAIVGGVASSILVFQPHSETRMIMSGKSNFSDVIAELPADLLGQLDRIRAAFGLESRGDALVHAIASAARTIPAVGEMSPIEWDIVPIVPESTLASHRPGDEDDQQPKIIVQG